MSSLAKCLEKMKLSKHEAAILRGMAIENTEGGMAEQEAAIKAVRDYLASSLGQRAAFVQAIKDAGGEVDAFTEAQSAHENEIIDMLAEAEKAKADAEAKKEAERNRETAIADQEQAALAKVKESADSLAKLQKSVAESLKAAADALAPTEDMVQQQAQPVEQPESQPAPAAESGENAPKYSRAMDRFVSRNGESIFRNDEIALGYPSRKGEVVDYHIFDNATVAEYESRGERVPKDGYLGFVSLGVDKNGNINSLNYIGFKPDLQRSGMGEKVLRGILATIPDGARLRINSILPEARGFWEKMGVTFEDGRYGLENGELTRQSYERGRNPLNDGGADSGLAFSRNVRGDIEDDAGAGAASRRGFDDSVQSGTRLSIRDAQAVYDRVAKQFKNLPQVTILNRVGELPDRVQGLRDQITEDGVWDDVEAAYYDDEIFAFADNIRDEARFEHVLFTHEVTHYGLHGVFGKELDAALNGLMARSPELRRKATEARKLLGLDSNITAMKEVIADMPTAELYKLKGIDRFLAAVRDWLSKHGFTKLAESLDNVITNRVGQDSAVDAMLGDMLRAARDFARNGKPSGSKIYISGAAQSLTNTHGGQHDLYKPKIETEYSRAPNGSIAQALDKSVPEWVKSGSAALQSAASKIDTFAPRETIVQKVKGLSTDWQKRLVQGMVDAYAPLKELNPKAYLMARMTKSADGVLEGMLMYGKPMMDADGAIVGDLDGKGFLGAMKELNGEHDRFFMWIAGNRAERLMNEGREHLFTPEEISAMKTLNTGKMADNSPRAMAYAKAFQTFKDYNKSVMDIAEKTGLIDGEARHLWEHDFYVPFYRNMEDDKISGPTKIKGLVRQTAFKKLKGGEENLGDLMSNTLRNWSHLLSASLANQAAVASLRAAEGAGVATQVPADTKGATFAMVNGKQTHYEVSDPFVLNAITAMETAGFKGLPMQLMSTFKRYLTLGVTASPTFRIRNLMRDSIAAIGQNDISYNMMSNLAKGFKGTDKKSETYQQMLFGGGLMRFGTYLEDNRAQHVKRLIESGIDKGTILDSPAKVKAALSKMWDQWQDFGDRMENVNRSALYQQLRAEGKTHQEASFAARDMMDFSMQGSWTAIRFLTQIVPFMNARMQGLYKMGRAAKEDPKRMGYVVGAVSLASIGLMLAYGDDDDWKKREDWDRDAFWWFKIGDVAFRIPKPFEIGAIGTIAERSLELMISDEMTGKRFAKRMGSMVGDTFAMNPVPQFFKPMIDLYANQDSFTGRAIETRGMENMSKSERSAANTSLVARMLGAAGDFTGLSPVQVDHLIRGYFGWLGSHAAMTVDLMAQPFSDVSKPDRKIGDMFVIGDFVKDLPQNGSRYVEDFYKQAKAVSEVMADIKHAREAGDIAKAQELIQDNQDKVAMHRLYSHAERTMGDINRQIRLTQARNIPGDEKRARLDQLTAIRNRLAQTVNAQSRSTLQ